MAPGCEPEIISLLSHVLIVCGLYLIKFFVFLKPSEKIILALPKSADTVISTLPQYTVILPLKTELETFTVLEFGAVIDIPELLE